MTSQHIKVVIVGAGPAGLVLGNALLRNGIDCAIVEQRTRAYVEQRARAGLIQHRTVEALRDLGLAERLLAAGARHTSCEFRAQDLRFTLDYATLADGATHTIYPQQNLVRDLIAAFIADGGDLRFDTPVIRLHPCREHPAVALGDGTELTCDILAGADGAHGVTRAALPATAIGEHHRHYPYRWITVLAAAPPSTTQIIYGAHRDGFAGHMLRTSTVSRYYLQCGIDDTPDDWPDDRIWEALQHRLATSDGWTLTEGPILDTGLLDMSTFVTTGMQAGNVYLLGDAAHVITPAGGKGMNLAIGDAIELARAIGARLHQGSTEHLKLYTSNRLGPIWQAQHFSDWLLHLINTAPADDDPDFDYQLRRARLTELAHRADLATWFARNYAGLEVNAR
ncbi:4-hydroxybenzoate 3-monooxygenase [Nocardia wallacei]|uniref:4-hydroxybenzoate 3-monooxygenase n=1 Tax=Nocardia wallacei TaxID=480035 RepID=UPI0024583C49|nr:4-hydroxybenzoate 3-monooxygenase [Nocardia wallacei]